MPAVCDRGLAIRFGGLGAAGSGLGRTSERKAETVERRFDHALSWVSSTPFGVPVEPEVSSTSAGSRPGWSGGTGSTTGRDGAADGDPEARTAGTGTGQVGGEHRVAGVAHHGDAHPMRAHPEDLVHRRRRMHRQRRGLRSQVATSAEQEPLVVADPDDDPARRRSPALAQARGQLGGGRGELAERPSGLVLDEHEAMIGASIARQASSEASEPVPTRGGRTRPTSAAVQQLGNVPSLYASHSRRPDTPRSGGHLLGAERDLADDRDGLLGDPPAILGLRQLPFVVDGERLAVEQHDHLHLGTSRSRRRAPR